MAATSTIGTILKRGDGGGSEVFTAIGEITSIGGIGEEVSITSTTPLSSTYAKKLAGVIDGGSLDLTINLDSEDNEISGLRTDMRARTLRNFQLVLPTETNITYSFAAYVSTFKIDAGEDSQIVANVSLAVDGQITES